MTILSRSELNAIHVPDGKKLLNTGALVDIDTPTALTSNGRVLLTGDQIKAEEERAKKWEAEAPMREWIAEIRQTDRNITRFMEDLIDVLSDTQKAKMSPQLKAAYDEKKAVRAAKP